jgi:hypothetical protein
MTPIQPTNAIKRGKCDDRMKSDTSSNPPEFEPPKTAAFDSSPKNGAFIPESSPAKPKHECFQSSNPEPKTRSLNLRLEIEKPDGSPDFVNVTCADGPYGYSV